jgi:N-acetylmuramic acid 6-phosphate etherase
MNGTLYWPGKGIQLKIGDNPTMLTSTTIPEPSMTTEKPKRDTAAQLQQLTTESQNEASQGLDTKSALEIARIINHEDAKIAAAVKKALPEIAQVIDQVARSLRDGGRLIYVGAGSSGGAVHHGRRSQGPRFRG